MERSPLLSNSELVCLTVAQALLGYRAEAWWLRFARELLADMFPYLLPQQSGCNKRLLTALPLVKGSTRSRSGGAGPTQPSAQVSMTSVWLSLAQNSVR